MADAHYASSQQVGEQVSEKRSLGWNELWLKEDWWAIWLGLGLVLVAYILFAQGTSLKWLTVTPAKWSNFSQLTADLSANALRYVAQFAFWLAAFSIALTSLGHKARTSFRHLQSFTVSRLRSLRRVNGIRRQSIIWSRRSWHSLWDC